MIRLLNNSAPKKCYLESQICGRMCTMCTIHLYFECNSMWVCIMMERVLRINPKFQRKATWMLSKVPSSCHPIFRSTCSSISSSSYLLLYLRDACQNGGTKTIHCLTPIRHSLVGSVPLNWFQSPSETKWQESTYLCHPHIHDPTYASSKQESGMSHGKSDDTAPWPPKLHVLFSHMMFAFQFTSGEWSCGQAN